ncbi:hypothetical protein MKW98_029741 [Papaver atlanticum]|uniref:Uncharacterized protein n=1 Tax=Papaver atlanticum TaxID=357466 RepID=A0AAD4T4H9_9MAGN|nr:hypothetical protein MKW98_029741 [Papaver atlanticum]
MLEFDEQINDPEEGLDESHEEDVQEEMIWMLQHYIFGGIKMFFTWFRNKQLLEMVQWGFHNLIMQTTTEKGKHYCRKVNHGILNLLLQATVEGGQVCLIEDFIMLRGISLTYIRFHVCN